MEEFDVIVVGAGHAGCEAALAAARLGCKTALITISLDTIAQMACNPVIGGPAAKSHLVREIDALGGEMGRNIDKTFLNIRKLNLSRGPAVHALRAQADKKRYQAEMTLILETERNLHVRQGIVTKVLVSDNKVVGVETRTNKYGAKAVVLCTGTFLAGTIVVGSVRYPGGRQGELAAEELSVNLRELGFSVGRFQTATPPRIDARTVDFSKLAEQPGSREGLRFSFWEEPEPRRQLPCWYTKTTAETVKVIRENLFRSPIRTGSVSGPGPRFCPSIDRKVIRFPDKLDHQIFLEPEGSHTRELYVLGLTTAMPEDVQVKIVRSIPGLERAEIMRPGYAVEYDFIIPSQVRHTLETRVVEGLFTAGQINGTSGYEEAAAQGIIAGINAARKVKGEDGFTLDRGQAYIGVLIDDIVTKGVTEPYRMMTSRAEYRLLLRLDNADMRLADYGYTVGLLTEEHYDKSRRKKRAIESEIERLKSEQVTPTTEVREALKRLESGDLQKAVTLAEILQRPEISYEDLALFTELPPLSHEEREEVEVEIKFSGYIERQMRQVEEFRRLERWVIPEDIDYDSVRGIRNEARDRLKQFRPRTVGEAGRLPGVSQPDLSVLLVHIKSSEQGGQQGA